MTNPRAQAKVAAVPMKNSFSPFLFNLGFLAIAMAVAALAVFGS